MRLLLTLSPFPAIPACQWLGSTFPSPFCLITAFLVMFLCAFASLWQLHVLFLGRPPRFR